jgi:hypothetical protein
MRIFFRQLVNAFVIYMVIELCSTSFLAATEKYVVTNDDVNGPNTVTFYRAGGSTSEPRLIRLKTIQTGGMGLGGGYFGMVRQVLIKRNNQECIFAADGQSNDIAGILFRTQTVQGNFKGSSSDQGGQAGLGLSVNPSNNYLYAAFAGSQTIATFSIRPNCSLTFVSDVPASGLNGGFPHGMAAKGNILVVTYGDGSIESFNISSGTPVSNKDLQLATGFVKDGVFPDGVDISEDGHFAIFGDASRGFTEVDISDVSLGKLATTVKYGGSRGGLGRGLAANNVWLSPDETLLYISNNLSGQVTAAYFHKGTGKLDFGCISKPLRGYGTKWTFSSAIATEGTSGAGSVLWVAEDGLGSSQSSIGILEVKSKVGKCGVTEAARSPALDPNSLNLCWLNAFPVRPF